MPKKDGTPTRGELRVKKGRLKPEKLAERQAKQIDRSPDAVKHALITEALKTKLPEHANEIADNLIKMAKSRDHQAAIPATKIILERTDGPVKQQLDVTTGDKPITTIQIEYITAPVPGASSGSDPDTE